jgi:hypothetical protein
MRKRTKCKQAHTCTHTNTISKYTHNNEKYTHSHTHTHKHIHDVKETRTQTQNTLLTHVLAGFSDRLLSQPSHWSASSSVVAASVESCQWFHNYDTVALQWCYSNVTVVSQWR